MDRQGRGHSVLLAKAGWFIWTLIAVAAYFVTSFTLAILVSIFRLQGYVTGTIGALMAHVFLLLGMVGLMQVGNYLISRRPFSLQEMGIARTLRWRDIGLGLAGFVLYGLLSTIVLSIAKSVPGFNIGQAQQLGVTTLFGSERILGFVVLVVVTPFFEELLFRGILFSKIRENRVSLWPAMILVSALFAIAHGQWNVGLDVFCMSMVACYLREATGSIWAGIIVHMMKNMIAFYFMFVALQGLGS